MSNPFASRRSQAGKPGRTFTARETRSKRAAFLERLGKVGATADEVESFNAIWDDPDGWVIPRNVLIRLSDSDLREILMHTRREHYQHTHTEAEEAADEVMASVSAAALVWEDEATRPHTVKDVLAWVGDDLGRAAVALYHEERSEEPRSTLVTPLEGMVEQDYHDAVTAHYYGTVVGDLGPEAVIPPNAVVL